MSELNVGVLGALEFRFTDPEDVAAYGDRWWRYDEAAILRMPARRLVELEQATGYPVRTMLAELRKQAVLGDLLACWTAIWLADGPAAGTFEAFTPVTFTIEWRAAVEDDLGKGDGSSPGPSGMPSVAIATLPRAG